MVILAEDICEKNPKLLSKAQNLCEIEQLLHYLRTRREKCAVSSPKNGEPPSVSMGQLDNYVDNLYEDERKVILTQLFIGESANAASQLPIQKHTAHSVTNANMVTLIME